MTLNPYASFPSPEKQDKKKKKKKLWQYNNEKQSLKISKTYIDG